VPGSGGAPASRLDPPARAFTMVASGDILTENAVLAAMAARAAPGQRYDLGALLAPIEPIVSSADLAICHVELPMNAPGQPPLNLGKSAYGGNRLVSPYEVAAGIAATGFDRCSTASNHSNDIGAGGIDQTLAALDASGVSHVGTARSPAEADPAAQIVTVNAVRVAHLAFTRYTNTDLAGLAPWQLNDAVTDVQPVIEAARAARAAGADVVVVSLHLRVELQRGPTDDDRAFVTALTAAAPVDVVVLHGPHVVQPVERVNGSLVFWSVGNLISGMGTAASGRYNDPRTLDGLLAGVRVTQTAPGRFATEAWPVVMCVDPGTRTVHPGLVELADPATPAWIRPVLQSCVDRTRQLVPDVH
jgi:Bacterial capsule synthesis protein PGA_cap